MASDPSSWCCLQWIGYWQQLGCFFGRIVALIDRDRLKQWVLRVWGWDVDTLLPAHLAPVIGDGRLQLARAFQFLRLPQLMEHLENGQGVQAGGQEGTATRI